MLRAGTFLGNRYEIEELIGSGGTSEVYRADDLKLSRSVAIKVLKSEFSSDRSFVQKFRSEAQAAASLSHQNIVNVYDVGEDDGLYYIVMELIDGITLKRYIQRKGKLSSRETIGIAIQIAQGVEVAHAEHIIHRDLKPQNVMISRDGKIKVTDFGIARAASSQTISSNVMGSVHYISPEQARGGYCDERSDIYSLGVTMYEMVTGTLPYDGDSTVAVALKHIQGEALAPSEYAPDIYFSLERIIEKCMQKKPEYRYSTITALIQDLKRSLVSPNEDFVKISAVVAASSATRIISEDELAKINSAISDEEHSYLMGDEPDAEEYYDDNDENSYDDEEDEWEESGKRFEKLMIGIGIGVAVLVVILAVFVLGNVFGLFKKGAEETESAGYLEMQMPDIIGLEIDKATDVLEQNGLVYTIEAAQDSNYGNGIVVDTDPKSGEEVTADTVITVYVNATEVTIPANQIVGYTSAAASAALQNLGLNVRVVQEYSDEIEQGIVISCDPREGSTLEMGDTVTLTVSMGSETEERTTAPEETTTAPEETTTAPEETTTAPEETTTAPEETTTAKKVEVPNVVGANVEDAIAKLESNGFDSDVSEQTSDTVAKGYVISQSPPAGSSAEEGSKVTIYVSAGSSDDTNDEPPADADDNN